MATVPAHRLALDRLERQAFGNARRHEQPPPRPPLQIGLILDQSIHRRNQLSTVTLNSTDPLGQKSTVDRDRIG
jgi:hypothetical protein